MEKETLGFPKGILANFIHIAEMIGRSLYCTVKGKEIIILNSFIKKTQKTPKNEHQLAKKRMSEVKK